MCALRIVIREPGRELGSRLPLTLGERRALIVDGVDPGGVERRPGTFPKLLQLRTLDLEILICAEVVLQSLQPGDSALHGLRGVDAPEELQQIPQALARLAQLVKRLGWAVVPDRPALGKDTAIDLEDARRRQGRNRDQRVLATRPRGRLGLEKLPERGPHTPVARRSQGAAKRPVLAFSGLLEMVAQHGGRVALPSFADMGDGPELQQMDVQVAYRPGALSEPAEIRSKPPDDARRKHALHLPEQRPRLAGRHPEIVQALGVEVCLDGGRVRLHHRVEAREQTLARGIRALVGVEVRTGRGRRAVECSIRSVGGREHGLALIGFDPLHFPEPANRSSGEAFVTT